MKLRKLFKAQVALDNQIVKEKGLEDQDLLKERQLALYTELGELANEWRGFKFWSEDQEPRTKLYKAKDNMGKWEVFDFNPDDVQEDLFKEVKEFNPLLEEYVDCLHFLLSIGIQFRIWRPAIHQEDYTTESTTEAFNKMFTSLAELDKLIEFGDDNDIYDMYNIIFTLFIELGEKHLEFTWEEVEIAYFEKNQVNYTRQLNGY